MAKGIRQRGSSWLVDVTVNGKRRTATCKTFAEAEEKRAALMCESTGGRGSQPWSIGFAFERTCERVWKGTRSEGHATRNGQMAVDFFGADTPLDQIDSAWIDQWVETLERKGSSDATINRKLAALSKIFTVAAQRGGCTNKPYIPKRKESQGRIRYLGEGEEEELLATFYHFGKREHRDAVIVLVDTGIRTGELWNLRACDIDSKNKLIHVWENKGDLPRSVPMTDRVAGVIARRLSGLDRNDRLFPYDNWWMRNGWARVRDHLGHTDDPQFVPHMLRHTCASRLIQRGAPLKVVQEWLGHKTISITMRYSHLAPRNLQAAASLLESRDAQ